jgi:hypothetical protein
VTIVLETTSVSKVKILPIELEAAYQVASNLRPDDRRECVEGHGIDPIIHVVLASQEGFCRSFTMPNGETAGIVGIIDDQIWMLCTPVIHQYPLTFAREAKRFMDTRTEPYLWNVVDKRNTAHIKLLKFLGFTFHEELLFGPNNLPFIRFDRWIH